MIDLRRFAEYDMIHDDLYRQLALFLYLSGDRAVDDVLSDEVYNLGVILKGDHADVLRSAALLERPSNLRNAAAGDVDALQIFISLQKLNRFFVGNLRILEAVHRRNDLHIRVFSMDEVREFIFADLNVVIVVFRCDRTGNHRDLSRTSEELTHQTACNAGGLAVVDADAAGSLCPVDIGVGGNDRYPGIHRSVDRLSDALGIDRADDDAVRSRGDGVINKFLLPFGILKFADGVGDFNIKADLIVYAFFNAGLEERQRVNLDQYRFNVIPVALLLQDATDRIRRVAHLLDDALHLHSHFIAYTDPVMQDLIYRSAVNARTFRDFLDRYFHRAFTSSPVNNSISGSSQQIMPPVSEARALYFTSSCSFLFVMLI